MQQRLIQQHLVFKNSFLFFQPVALFSDGFIRIKFYMNENDKNKDMRGADIVIGILFMLLGVGILIVSFQMPLKASYGGVQGVWYVSPALLPIIIGVTIILLSISILIYGIKQGGLDLLKASIAKRKKEAFFNDDTVRMLATLVPLIALVFINMPMIDFPISIAIYLMFTIGVFYSEKMEIIRKGLAVYSIMTALNLIIRVFALNKILDGMFIFTTDILALVELIYLIFFIRKLMFNVDGEKVEMKMRFKKSLRVSWITPLVITAIFRFGLRVPMPKEGFIMNFMYLIYYAIK